ncbi:RidA family protein [Actinomadura yumaensis]|uniref:RidA family protein n=1 Tax=Actinomadura TaxID=1988 RepID=UPI001F4FAEB9|nr:Rid family hydrolase [Actinomadura sp. J1-007]
MPLSISNPSTLHDPVGFGYSHVAKVTAGELVLIAGQYASDGEGQVTTSDFAGQVDEALANLGKALESAGLGYRDVAQLRTFIVDHDSDKLAVIGTAIGRIWGTSRRRRRCSAWPPSPCPACVSRSTRSPSAPDTAAVRRPLPVRPPSALADAPGRGRSRHVLQNQPF